MAPPAVPAPLPPGAAMRAIAPFSLQTPPRILFGAGRFRELAAEIGGLGRQALLVVGGGSFTAASHFRELCEQLQRRGIAFSLARVVGEPTPTTVDTIVNSIAGATTTAGTSSEQPVVVAIGGGAVLDAGKAVSAMLVEGGPVRRFLEGVGDASPSGRRLPLIAVPTTAGTGSEATANAVLSEVGEAGFKKSLRHHRYLPDLALVDPLLALSCPPGLTLACAMDCLSQLVEGYLSTRASAVTDALALDGLRTICRSLERVCRDGNDHDARCDLAYAALLSGIVLSNAGLGTVHGLAAELGGRLALPHGVICGSLMAAVNRLTLTGLRRQANGNPALDKYTTLGKLCSQRPGATAEWYQEAFIAWLEALQERLPGHLGDSPALTPALINGVVARAANKNNPLPLSADELTALLGSLRSRRHP